MCSYSPNGPYFPKGLTPSKWNYKNRKKFIKFIPVTGLLIFIGMCLYVTFQIVMIPVEIFLAPIKFIKKWISENKDPRPEELSLIKKKEQKKHLKHGLSFPK